MSLLARLRGNPSQPEYDPLLDGHDVTEYALASFHNVVDNLNYANAAYQDVKDKAVAEIAKHQERHDAARKRQEQNTRVINKVKNLLGEELDAGHTDS